MGDADQGEVGEAAGVAGVAETNHGDDEAEVGETNHGDDEARLDQRLDAALASAELYPLLCAVAHLTGDLSLLREAALDQAELLVPEHGLTPEQDAEARRLAGEALRAHIGTVSGSLEAGFLRLRPHGP